MNRRGFISLLGGLAAAPLVPWRGLVEPTIFLPPRPKLIVPPLMYADHQVGRMVTCVRAGPRAESYHQWAVAQAVYLGEYGWRFIGGEWMTERDRRDFIDTIAGNTLRITDPRDVPNLADITTVVLHR